jgi:hypothetical protein
VVTDGGGYALQQKAPLVVMALTVIDDLEIIDIDPDDGDGLAVACAPCNLPVEHQVCGPQGQQACQFVSPGQDGDLSAWRSWCQAPAWM